MGVLKSLEIQHMLPCQLSRCRSVRSGFKSKQYGSPHSNTFLFSLILAIKRWWRGPYCSGEMFGLASGSRRS